ncbi:MAG: pentapeptide repeat-containing protein [Pseudomonadota bacterium]
MGFNGAKLINHTYFQSTKFLEDAIFHTTEFSDTTLFNHSEFHSNVWFDHATFRSSAFFNDTEFLGEFSQRHSLRFFSANFLEDLFFNPSCLPDDLRFASGSFRGSRVARLAYVQSPDFTSFAAFNGMEIERKIELSDEVLFDDDLLHSVIKRTAELPPYEISSTQFDANRWVRELAGGARVFEGSMKNAGNKEAAFWFRRMELLTLRHHSSTSRSIQFFTDAYETCSAFGSSISRPICLLAAASLICAVIYWTQSFHLGPDCRQPFAKTCAWDQAAEQIVPALTFSANSTFRPAYAISREERIASPFDQKILFGNGWKGGLRAVLLVTLSTLQSLFSLVMLFLTGLAARRYYQLS